MKVVEAASAPDADDVGASGFTAAAISGLFRRAAKAFMFGAKDTAAVLVVNSVS